MRGRRFAGTVAVALAAGLLVGCGGAGPAAPTVEWVDGEPSGEYEDDPWVVAARAGDLEMAAATNANDFTGDELEATVGSSLIDQIAHARVASANDDAWYFLPGPTPMVVLEVREGQDGRIGVVQVCEAADWSVDADRPEPPTQLRGQVREYELIRSSSTGERKLDGVRPVAADECDLSGVAVGVFDPQPDPSATYAPEDVEQP